MNTLSARLKIAREALGKTQKEMSSLLDLSANGWQPYERGTSIPGGKVIEGLAKLGLNLNWIMTGKGEMWERKGGGVSQHASNNVGIIQSAGTVSGSITQGGGEKLPEDIQELCELLQRYGNKTLKDDLKARLLRIKEAMEG